MEWDTTTVVVPFRLASERFPNKVLERFRGRTLIEHALAHGCELSPRQIVLTGPPDDLRKVQDTLDLSSFRHRFVPSSESCRCATDRLVEIYQQLDGDHFLSLPTDEPAIDPAEIRRALSAGGALEGAGAFTFFCPFFAREDYLSPLSAKIVTDRQGMMLYMSRAVIPVGKDGSVDESKLKKNVGAFLFDRGFLDQLSALAGQPTTLDRHEGLEQLRWLELGLRLRCLPIEHIGFGIDVPEQLAVLDERLACR